VSRLDRLSTYMAMAEIIANRATCNKARVGCVVTDGWNRIAGVGYNGNPPNMPHCSDLGCVIVDGRCISTLHAEVNALLQIRPRSPIVSYTVYCTHSPCLTCLKIGVSLGVSHWYYLTHYEDLLRDGFLEWYNNNTSELNHIKLMRVKKIGENTYAPMEHPERP